MKIILASLTAAGVGFGAAYLYVSNTKTSEFQKEKAALESQWSGERDKLERDLKGAKSRTGRVEQITETVEVVKTVQKTPKEILDKLVQLKPGSGNARYSSIREIIHHLESLAEIGPGALPDIRAFLKENMDVSYERERRQNTENGQVATAGAPGQPGQGGPGGGGPGGPGGGGPGGFGGFGGPPPWANNGGNNELPQTEDYYPYSLRMGLFDVVKKIGGTQAETILSEALQTTGRGVEVAHLTQLLEEMAPNKYVALAVAAAKDLLANPLTIENPTRLDEMSKMYLYAILRKFNDTTFVATAQQLAIQADGRLDRSALGYLTSTLKEQSATMLYAMYNDARVTNNVDRATIAGSALNYVGMNATSDQMFRDIMGNEEAGGMRFLALARLDDGTLTPEVIQSRLNLVQGLRFEDERMQRMVENTVQGLQRKANPQAEGNNNGDNRRRGFDTFFGGGAGGGGRGPGGQRN